MLKIMFDLDGTITAQETLPLIAKHFQVQHEIAALTKETVAGNIPFIESFIRRVHILKHLPVSEVSSLLSQVPLYPKLHSFLKEHVDDCIIVTGNLDCWVDKLVEKLGLCSYSSQATVTNNQVEKIGNILKKEDIVKKYQTQGYKVVFVGEGNNDMEAMRLADVSIASGLTHQPAKSVLTICNYAVFGEEALCRLLSQLY